MSLIKKSLIYKVIDMFESLYYYVKHYNTIKDILYGDEFKKLLKVIREGIRKSDIIIRYGGDEFLLVMPDISAEVFAEKLKQIRKNISEAKVPGYSQIHLTVSIQGKALAPVFLKKSPQSLFAQKLPADARLSPLISTTPNLSR